MRAIAIIRLAAIAGAFAAFVSSNAAKSQSPNHSAQQMDPYAAGARQLRIDRWKENFNRAKNEVAYIAFAYGCKVIKIEAQVTILLQGGIWTAVMNEAGPGLNFSNIREINEWIKAAGREGFYKSQQPGACDAYWNDRKEEAYALRNRANRLFPYNGNPVTQMPAIMREDH